MILFIFQTAGFLQDAHHTRLFFGIGEEIEFIDGMPDKFLATITGVADKTVVDLYIYAVLYRGNDNHVRAGEEGFIKLLLRLVQFTVGLFTLDFSGGEYFELPAGFLQFADELLTGFL